MRTLLSTLIMLAVLCAGASAATVFDDGDAANSYIENANNWDNGAPSAANPGTISVNAKVGLNTMTNWVVTQTAGDITQGSFPNLSFGLKGGSWTMDGGSMSQRAHTYSDGAVFTLNNGVITTKNNSTITVHDSQLIVNGGTINADRNLYLRAGAFTINGGTITQDTADAFGAPGFLGSGTMKFNGGTVTGGRFAFQGTTSATFGGTNAGTTTFVDWGSGNYTSSGDRHRDTSILLDFLSGTQMSLTLTNPRALDFTNDSVDNPLYAATGWGQALWETDRLLYNGQSATDLGGVTWTAATSTGFGDGKRFNYDGSGTERTLSLIPEPATLGTLALFGTMVLLRRRAGHRR